MSQYLKRFYLLALILPGLLLIAGNAQPADKLIGLHSAQVMSQSMPWIAQEAGLFKKYDLDFRLVFIPSSPVATAATLNGDAEIGVTGAVGNVRAYVQGFTDLVFIGGVKNILTHSILGKPEIKRPEDLKGKKVGVGRFGGNTESLVSGAQGSWFQLSWTIWPAKGLREVRIKLDENLGRPHVALLKRHGYEADRVFDQGLSGIEDAEHFGSMLGKMVNL